jgi:hypothetical protein
MSTYSYLALFFNDERKKLKQFAKSLWQKVQIELWCFLRYLAQKKIERLKTKLCEGKETKMAGFLLAGSLRFGDESHPNLFTHVGETDKFEIQPQSERKTLISRQEGTYGQAISTVSVPKETTISIVLRDFSRKNIAAAFLGEDSNITVEQGNVTANYELFPDKETLLQHRKLSNVVVAHNSGNPAYVENTDYTINARDGLLKTLSTGSITERELVKIAYTHAASNGFKIKGAVKNSITVPVILLGKNLANEKRMRFLGFQAVLAPSGPIDFLSDDFASIELQGILQIPEGKDTPFEYEEFD